MIAVIFEAFPAKEKGERYLDLAAKLRPELSKIQGFISIERFQSMTNPDKLLSLSFWEDEKSIAEWRNLDLHRLAQTEGRNFILNDYRLRIAEVHRDYGKTDRTQAPADSQLTHPNI